MGVKSRKHAIKPFIHIGIVLTIAFVVIGLNHFGLLTEKTQVPDVFVWIIDRVMSTRSLVIGALVVLVLALLHKRFERTFHLRKGLRWLFFFALAFVTGKFYTWSGLLLGIWLIGRLAGIGQASQGFLVYSAASLLLGLITWLLARGMAFKWARSFRQSPAGPKSP